MAKNGRRNCSDVRDVWSLLEDAVRSNDLVKVDTLCEEIEQENPQGNGVAKRARGRVSRLFRVAGSSGILERLEACHGALGGCCGQDATAASGARYSPGRRRATLYGHRQSATS